MTAARETPKEHLDTPVVTDKERLREPSEEAIEAAAEAMCVPSWYAGATEVERIGIQARARHALIAAYAIDSLPEQPEREARHLWEASTEYKAEQVKWEDLTPGVREYYEIRARNRNGPA